MSQIAKGETLFVIDIHYTAPLSAIDALIPAHVAFLERHYASGTFIASGPKIPREGGVILARGGSKEEIETLVRDDPFATAGAAEYRTTEFLVRMVSGLGVGQQ